MWNADIIGILFSVYSSGILVPVVGCMFVCPSPPHSHVETLTHSVRIFGDRVFERQLDYECGVPITGLVFLREKTLQNLHPVAPCPERTRQEGTVCKL